MARIVRSTLPDGYFHVYARSVEEARLFKDAQDRRTFLGFLASATRQFRWQLEAICLMTSHYHLVVESTRALLSAGMHWLNGYYAQTFNLRHGRRGHLFGDRFGARAIQEEDYLRAACDYVLLNPVRAGLCDHAAQWPWSGSRSGFPDG
jgi:putative transposase